MRQFEMLGTSTTRRESENAIFVVMATFFRDFSSTTRPKNAVTSFSMAPQNHTRKVDTISYVKRRKRTTLRPRAGV
jgi:hypothetical protein